MLIRLASIGPSSKPKALAEASVEIELHNGNQADVIRMSGLSVERQTNVVPEILFVRFPAYRQANGSGLHLLSASTRLRRRIEDVVLDGYDAWCQASSSNCTD